MVMERVLSHDTLIERGIDIIKLTLSLYVRQRELGLRTGYCLLENVSVELIYII